MIRPDTVRHVLFAAVLCLTPGTAHADGTDDVPPWRWKEAGCFAFSPTLETYACVMLEGVPGEGDDDPYDVTPSADIAAMDAAFEHLQAVHARIALGIAIAGPDGWETEVLWRRRDFSTGDESEETLHAINEVEERLARDGFTVRVPPSRRVPLAHDVWTAVGDVEYRYRADEYVRDASFTYIGELQVRCSDDAEPREVVLPHALGGPWAMVSHASETSMRVITVHGHYGGEGYGEVGIVHWLFDEAELCR